MHLDHDRCYAAVEARDPRFDGRFFTGVLSTGIFCRPICPARTPRPDRVRFFPSAAAALNAGFRPCLRCRPDAVPGSAAWRGSATIVDRAMREIEGGALDHGATADDLASRVGVSARHLRRLFLGHLGASPTDVARSRRVLLARRLLLDTDLPVSVVASLAGFGSVRQFNAVVREQLGETPSSLRRRSAAPPTDRRFAARLQLAVREPLPWEDVLAFLAPRVLPGVETVADGAYERRLSGGSLRVHRGAQGLDVDVDVPDIARLADVLGRVRRLVDSDAPADVIAPALGRAPELAAAVAACPGRRVVGAFDPWETTVRVVLGQQVSVAAARTSAGRLVDRDGTGIVGPDELTAALRSVGMPRARAETLHRLAVAVGTGDLLLSPAADLARTRQRLAALPGIGPWTVELVAMRVLRDPDAFPASDLGVRRALGGMSAAAAERWAAPLRPWRSYAVMHLWMRDRTDHARS